jgi:hypothetical protein
MASDVSRTGDRLRRQGFDLTRYDRGTATFRVRCSQCEALVINGVACHERGCPNQRKPKEDEDDG